MSQSKSGVPWPITLVVGIVLMAGGWYVSKNWHPEFLKSLEAQGIPLDLGKTVSAIGVFLILFPVLKYFYFSPLDEAIDNRTSELERTFGEAENLRTEMATLRADYESRLAKTEAEAREQIQSSVREAQELSKQLRAEAAAQIEEMKKAAASDIAQERERAMRDIQLNVVNLTLMATERLVGQSVDSETNRKLVEEFIASVEVPR